MRTTGTTLADYIRHRYKLSKVLKTYTVYELTNSEGNINLLAQTIRIEQFQNKSNAKNINEYLRLRTTNSWATSEMVTGLKFTTKEGLFYGDKRTLDKEKNLKKHLLIFTFSKDRQTLFIDYYRGFYPFQSAILQNIISTY